MQLCATRDRYERCNALRHRSEHVLRRRPEPIGWSMEDWQTTQRLMSHKEVLRDTPFTLVGVSQTTSLVVRFMDPPFKSHSGENSNQSAPAFSQTMALPLRVRHQAPRKS